MAIRNHHHQLGIMVPYHPPEILDGMEERVLGNDEFIALVIALQNQREDKKQHWCMSLNIQMNIYTSVDLKSK